MEELDGKIKKEVINKEDLPTDQDHPGEEISEENKIIIGDAVEGVEPSPEAPPKPKTNYALIIVVIIAVLIGLFWGLKGCNERARQDSMSFVKPIAIPEWLS